MTPTIAQITPLLRHMSQWITMPNIQGLFVGPKQVAGRDTEELAIRFLVEAKKPVAELGEGDREIPPSLDLQLQDGQGRVHTVQVKTDVVEVGLLRFASSTTLNHKHRPTCGGVEIAVPVGHGYSSGTLGANLVWGGAYRLITCNHVIACNSQDMVGASVYQPSAKHSAVSRVTGYVPMLSGPSDTFYNTYDFAWCNTDIDTSAGTVWDVGTVTGYRAPVLGEGVQWIGQQKGKVQTTTIAALNGIGKTKDEANKGSFFYFDSLISFGGGRAAEGDSGAAICAQSDMCVVGLITLVDGHGRAYGTPIPT